MYRHLAAAAVVAAFAGCASTPPADTTASRTPTASGPASSTARAPAAAPASSAPATAGNATGNAAGNANVAAPSQRSVYFDYDSNAVKDEYTGVVKSNAQYLATKRGARVVVEGNTDERGSREYNLALGQRRADAVKQRLTLLGVPAQQIETVSFGEEKPRADSETEQAFAENRRADIVYGR